MRSLKLLGPALALWSFAATHAFADDPLLASVRPNGDIVVSSDGINLAVVSYAIYLRGWSLVTPAASDVPLDSLPTPTGSMLPDVPFAFRWNGGTAEMHKTVSIGPSGLGFTHTVRPAQDTLVDRTAAHVALDATQWLGAQLTFDSTTVTLPLQPAQGLYSGTVSRVVLRSPLGKTLNIQFATPTYVRLQDSRAYVPYFDLFIADPGPGTWVANEAREAAFNVSATLPIEQVGRDPFVINQDSQWVPLQMLTRVTPGSALDWSNPAVQPAGSQGRVIINRYGQFAFEQAPLVGRRFYGVNIPQMEPLHADSDELADQLWRMGVNAVRLHHYDDHILRENTLDPTDFDPAIVDRLNYLLFALKQKGIYVTLDLFSGRPIYAGQLGVTTLGRNDFLAALLFDAAARDNYIRFAKALMDIENPYTGLRWKDDPQIAWLGVANEDGLSAVDKMTSTMRGRFNVGWQGAGGSGNWSPGTPEGARYGAGLQRAFFTWVRSELRGHGVDALLTAQSAMNTQGVHALNREDFDFVNQHFYWDHPIFIGSAHFLPTRGVDGGQSMVANMGGSLRFSALNRLIGKPFTLTEFAYAGPNRFRAEQGLAFGAIAGIQQWDAMWRYSYAQGERWIWQYSSLGHFGNQGDPLALAGDRMMVALFLRGDVNERVRPNSMQLQRSELGSNMLQDAIGNQLFQTPIGTQFSDSSLAARSRMWQTYRRLGTSVRLHPQSNTMTLTSARTAGLVTNANGYAVAGLLSARVHGTRGVVWATAIDGRTLLSSRRLLVAHLTDVQNTGAVFRDVTRDTWVQYGSLPHLARVGSADIALRLPTSRNLRVYRLDMAGNRLAEVPATQRGGRVTFTATVASDNGATLYYEIVR